MDAPVISFEEALARAGSGKRHLLMGNGFSISCKPDIFSYSSLLEQADFAAAKEIPKVFEILKTNDFEAVIKLLSNAAGVIAVFGGDNKVGNRLAGAANMLKDILVRAIAQHHPDRPYSIGDERYGACRVFLSNFETYYTLNYDVLLYWALMNEDIDKLTLRRDDGFRSPEEETAEYVSWQEFQTANVYHLHGALHLFDEGAELRKYTWSRTEVPILEQIRRALDEGKYPLFVAEGTSHGKMEKIMHSAYLHKGYRSLRADPESC